MSLNTANIAAYVAGANIGPDMDAISASVAAFLVGSDEPTAALQIPVTLSAAVSSVTDLLALLWVVATGVNEELVLAGARCYVAESGGNATLLVRRL
jgi:allophanate hydrolase subunit 2